MSSEYKQSLIKELLAKGEGFYVSGKYQGAIEIYEIILAIEPGNKKVLQDMAFAMSKLKEREETEEAERQKGLILIRSTPGMTSSIITGLDGNRIDTDNSFLFKQNSENVPDPDDYEELQEKYLELSTEEFEAESEPEIIEEPIDEPDDEAIAEEIKKHEK